MIRINLIPPEFSAIQEKKNQQLLLGTAGSIAAFLLILLWVVKSRQAATLQTQIAQAEADLAKYQSIVSQIERIEADKAQLSAKRDVIRNLNRSRLIYPVFFEDLLPIIPSDVWVTNIQISEQGNQMKINMNSNATSNFAVATWLSNLQQSTHFSGIDLSAISYTTNDQGTQLSFNITCTYQHQGPFPLSEYN
jgi:type IV pilus assembly protein PilN